MNCQPNLAGVCKRAKYDTFACAGAQARADLPDARVDDGGKRHQWEMSGTTCIVARIKIAGKINL